MIAYLNGSLIEKNDNAIVIDVNGVGYEVFCSSRAVVNLPDTGNRTQLYIHTQYRADGAALFGFLSTSEKNLFLELIKVDSVGPKSALNILSAAPWVEIAQLIEDGDVSSLSKLPKISKKTAEHLVVKLKGKLEVLFITAAVQDQSATEQQRQKVSSSRKLRGEAQSALLHLGYKPHEIERALNDMEADVWSGELQSIIRAALSDLSGNIS
jgi:Holliday junction DNA helicase RuvA